MQNASLGSKILDFESGVELLGKSPQALYLKKYLQCIGAKSIILEAKYIDKDYIIDYSNFYSRSFDDFPNYTERFHFFSINVELTSFDESIECSNQGFIDSLKASYLGFIVLKFITDPNGNRLIGRTILKTYERRDGDETRVFLMNKWDSSLFGIHLQIEGLPFMTQDKAVCECATSSLWVSQHPLNKEFSTSILSPSEISKAANLIRDGNRIFPSNGLSITQMIRYFNYLDVECEIINLENENNDSDYFIPEVIKKYANDETSSYRNYVPFVTKAYIDGGIPIVAGLELTSIDDVSLYHAVVICGYRSDKKRNIKELYVHDDQIGPYSRVNSDDGFLTWKNEWTSDKDCCHPHFDTATLKHLIIPLYPKIRLPFDDFYYRIYSPINHDFEEQGLCTDFFLTSLNKYKNNLLYSSFKGLVKGEPISKVNVLKKEMPKYLWVIRAYNGESIVSDYVYDGTSTFINKIITILYSYY